MSRAMVVGVEAQRSEPTNHAPVFPFNHVYPTRPSPGPPHVSYNSFMMILVDLPRTNLPLVWNSSHLSRRARVLDPHGIKGHPCLYVL